MSDGVLRTPVLSQQEDAPVAKDAVPASEEEQEEEDQEEREVDKAAELLLPLTQEDKKRAKSDLWGAAYQPHKKLKARGTRAEWRLKVRRDVKQGEEYEYTIFCKDTRRYVDVASSPKFIVDE